MASQKIFRTSFVETLISNVNGGPPDEYMKGDFVYTEDDLLVNEKIIIEESELNALKASLGKDNADNAKGLHAAYRKLTPEQASDGRFWAYLTHVTFREFMQRAQAERLAKSPGSLTASSVTEHWFVSPVNAQSLFRNDLSYLWWGAHLTHDSERSNPYELSAEFFSTLEYTRHLHGNLGRSATFTKALMEFFIAHRDDLASAKDAKIRFLMPLLNEIGGYREIPSLSREEITSLLELYLGELKSVTKRTPTQ